MDEITTTLWKQENILRIKIMQSNMGIIVGINYLLMEYRISVISTGVDSYRFSQLLGSFLNLIRIFTTAIQINLKPRQFLQMISKEFEKLSVAFAPYHFANIIGNFAEGLFSMLQFFQLFLANFKKLGVYSMNIAYNRIWIILGGS